MAAFFPVLLLSLWASAQSQCSFPTNDEVVNLLQQTIDLLESQEGEPGGTVSNVSSPHFVCLATRGLDLYESVSIVVNYTFTPNSGGPVELRTDQFEPFCNMMAGVWGPTSNFLEENLPSMPFDIELKDQCVSCTQTFHSALLYYDNITNCFGCSPTCTSLGGGYCTQAGNSLSYCCPYFNGETSECVSDCASIDPNFVPNEQFICVAPISCPSNCDECNETGCCTTCSEGYVASNCICEQVIEYCQLPSFDKVIEILQLTIDLLELQEGEPGGTVSNVSSPHFVCLATRGLDLYESVSIVVNYTFTPNSGGPVEVRTDQFELFCNMMAGVWGPTSNFLEENLPSMPFDIELKDQCVSCTQTFHSALLYYDNITNCLGCSPTCTSLGGGYCTQAGNSLSYCCPYFNGETSECVSDCASIDPNFVPNEQFICTSCPTECTECDEDGCCMTCSTDYQADNCTCTKMIPSTMSPTPSPSCDDLEGCLSCAPDEPERACCSECNGQSGFTLIGCGCSKVSPSNMITNEVVANGLSTTTVTGIAVGITVFFILVTMLLITLFLILYHTKHVPKQTHQNECTPNYIELDHGGNFPIHEQKSEPATLPYVSSTPTENSMNCETQRSRHDCNTSNAEYLTIIEAPPLPDRSYTNSFTNSENVYDNDDDIEVMKKTMVLNGQQQSEKKDKESIIKKSNLNNKKEDEDEDGYVSMGQVAEYSINIPD